MTLAEINPLAELTDGSFVVLDAHMEMENEARPAPEGPARSELEIADDDTRETVRADRLRAQRGARSTPPTTAA